MAEGRGLLATERKRLLRHAGMLGARAKDVRGLRAQAAAVTKKAISAYVGMVEPAHWLLDIQFRQAAGTAFLARVRMHIAPISDFHRSHIFCSNFGAELANNTLCTGKPKKKMSGTALHYALRKLQQWHRDSAIVVASFTSEEESPRQEAKLKENRSIDHLFRHVSTSTSSCQLPLLQLQQQLHL